MAPWQVPAAIAEEAHYLAWVFAHPVAALQKCWICQLARCHPMVFRGLQVFLPAGWRTLSFSGVVQASRGASLVHIPRKCHSEGRFLISLITCTSCIIIRASLITLAISSVAKVMTYKCDAARLWYLLSSRCTRSTLLVLDLRNLLFDESFGSRCQADQIYSN